MSTEVMTTENVETTTPEVVVEVDPMVRQLASITELLDTLSKTSKSLTVEMKALTKDVNKLRLSKAGGKKQKRLVDPDAPRKLGALEKPVPITDELADFLGLTKGETYSRQQVTQSVNKFVKDNDLQNPENRRYILLESEAGLKLKALLRDPDQPLTFFNIQRYLKVHYPKVESDSEVETTKAKSVDVTDTPVTTTDKVVPDKVVPDEAVVDESTDKPVQKKVVRRVVKKTVPASA